jgi:hypothetical protein
MAQNNFSPVLRASNLVAHPHVKKIWQSPAFWIFGFLLSLYLLTAGGQLFVSDGVVMYLQTRAILHDHTLAIINSTAPEAFFLTGPDQLKYGRYDLGQPLAAMPFYLIGWMLAKIFPKGDEVALTVYWVSLLPQVATALSGVILYRIGMTLFKKSAVAAGIALLWGTGTFAWVYSKIYFPEALITLCLLLAYWLLERATAQPSRRAIFFAGLAFGCAVSVRLAAGIYLLAFLGYLFVVAQDESANPRAIFSRWFMRACLFALGLTPVVMLWLWHNHARFQNAWQTGYPGESFSTPLYIGLFGLLASPGRSLFLFAPLALCGIICLWSFRRRFPATTVFVLIAFVTALVFYGQWWAWHGGFSWGPRFLVPVLPFLLIPLGDQMTTRRFWIVLACVWLLSFLVILPGISVDFHRYFTDALYGDRLNEDALWFDPPHSQILVQWRYLLNGYALSFGGNHLSDFGMPRFLNYVYLPLMGALALFALIRIAIVVRNTRE